MKQSADIFLPVFQVNCLSVSDSRAVLCYISHPTEWNLIQCTTSFPSSATLVGKLFSDVIVGVIAHYVHEIDD